MKPVRSTKKMAADAQIFIDAHSTIPSWKKYLQTVVLMGLINLEYLYQMWLLTIKEDNGNISLGVSKYIGNAILETNLSPQEIAERISEGTLDITKMNWHDDFETELALNDIALATVERIKEK